MRVLREDGVTHERISGRKLWRMAINSSLRMLTVSGTRLTRLTIESVTICAVMRTCFAPTLRWLGYMLDAHGNGRIYWC